MRADCRVRYFANAPFTNLLMSGSRTYQRSIAVLLHTRGAQTCQAETVNGMLPGEEFLYRQRVAPAGIVEAQQTAAHRGHDFGLAADYPTACRRRRQIG